jgi:hypothetical protein
MAVIRDRITTASTVLTRSPTAFVPSRTIKHFSLTHSKPEPVPVPYHRVVFSISMCSLICGLELLSSHSLPETIRGPHPANDQICRYAVTRTCHHHVVCIVDRRLCTERPRHTIRTFSLISD